MRKEGWILPYIRAHWGRCLLIIGLGSLALLFAAGLMFTSGLLISKSVLRPENILMVYVPIVLVRTFGIGRAVLFYAERLAGHDTVLRIVSSMRERLYRILEPQALWIQSRFRAGDVLGVLSADIEHLQDVYLRTVFPGASALVMYAAAAAAVGRWDLRFALVLALYMFILVGILPWLSLMMTKAQTKLAKTQKAGMYRQLTDAVLGMGDWVISGREAQFLAAYEAKAGEAARTDAKLRTWVRFRQLAAQCVVGLILLTVLAWAAGMHADGKLPAVLIAAFVLVVFPVTDALLPVSEAVEHLPRYRDSLRRLSDLEGEESNVNGYGNGQVSGDQAAEMAGGAVHIRVEGAGFRYEGDSSWTLRDISLDIPQGKKVAIIGRSGAGKSTLLKLLEGALAPSEGEVTLNGVPAAAIGEHMPHIVSVLNQNPHLFDTSVANNIRLGSQGAGEEDIERAARQVKLDRLIESLPDRYHTRMHETGQRFSGGERQRIALARIWLRNNPVVLLDEPTVGLDPRTENELIRIMLDSLQGKSLIWVTHHLAGAEHMDEIVFMEDGRIVMRGSHVELMENEPRYRSLYQLDRPEALLIKAN